MTPSEILRQAAAEYAEALHREAVAAEVARMRAASKRTLWQRLVGTLPFTITIKRKPK